MVSCVFSMVSMVSSACMVSMVCMVSTDSMASTATMVSTLSMVSMDSMISWFPSRTLSWFGHGCSGDRMPLEHKRYDGFGMDALVTVCSWNRNTIMVWAWMLW